MLKLYKNLKARDWALVILIVGIYLIKLISHLLKKSLSKTRRIGTKNNKKEPKSMRRVCLKRLFFGHRLRAFDASDDLRSKIGLHFVDDAGLFIVAA